MGRKQGQGVEPTPGPFLQGQGPQGPPQSGPENSAPCMGAKGQGWVCLVG